MEQCQMFFKGTQQLYQRMRQERKDLHKSSFTFESFNHPEDNPQKDQIYCYHSTQIQECITGQASPPHTSTKFYQNNIFHSTHKYKIPVECSARPDRQFEHFYLAHRKFTKPYGTLTKFTDSLSQNRSLLRRGQNDIPLALPQPVPKKSSLLVKYQKIGRHRGKEEKGDYSLNMGFRLTLKQHERVVQSQMEKGDQRVGQSLNRLLAAEAIQDQIRPRNRVRSITEHY